MNRTQLFWFWMIKTGEQGSQAVYPRASKVERMPPCGKEDASGSPLTRSRPEKREMILRLPSHSRNVFCLPAVSPVNGMNQWVKWVTPMASDHFLISRAISSATSGSSDFFWSRVRRNFCSAWGGRDSFMRSRSKTWLANEFSIFPSLAAPPGNRRRRRHARRFTPGSLFYNPSPALCQSGAIGAPWEKRPKNCCKGSKLR